MGNWKLVREKSEVPLYHKEKLSRIDRIAVKFLFNLNDGIIVISRSLEEFFFRDLSINCSYHIIPILIEHFDEKPEYTINNNIVYTGSLLDSKDGVIRLLQAFSKVLKKDSSLGLVMTGDLNRTKDKERIISTIKEEGIESSVKFTGYINEKELKTLINSAKILILAKPKNRQNKYNSATKVGEYLLTGRPIILSKVDTSSDLLRDEKDVFIVEPTIEKLAEKIIYVLTNYKEAIKVGEQGRKAALKYFEYIGQTKKLNEFLKLIK